MAKKILASAAAGPSKAASSSSGKPEASIDDIFAKPAKPSASAVPSIVKSKKDKGKSKALPASNAAPSLAVDESAPKKKRKAKQIASFDPTSPDPPKPRTVETVVDPSLAAISAKVASAKASVSQDVGKRRRVKEDDDDETFRDSRGSGPRRKTEEGFSIYKEAELRINPEAGGTPLCPFDCDCSAYIVHFVRYRV